VNGIANNHQKSVWPLWFWLLTLLAPVVFLGLMHKAESRSALGAQWRVTDANYILSHDQFPPEPDSDWQPIVMPTLATGIPQDTVAVPLETIGDWKGPVSVWFRIGLPKTESDALANWILLVPRPNNTSYSLWLSGVRFAGVGDHDDKSTTSMPSNPVSLEFPELALRDGERFVYLRASKALGGINPNNIYLGPADKLRSYADHAIFVKKTLIRIILLMMGFMAAVTFLIHLLRRKHTKLYGWYALATTVWFIHTLHDQIESANFGSAWFWTRTTYVTLAAYVILGIVFVNRLTSQPQIRVERILLAGLVAGSVFILIDPVGVVGILKFNAYLWIPAIIAGGVYMLVRLARGVRKHPDTANLLLLAATFLGVCVGVRDYLYNNLQLVPGGMLYLRHAAGLNLVAYSFVMVRRFALETTHISNPSNEAKQADVAYPETRTEANLRDPNNSTDTQRLLLQQEHDELENQLQQAVLNIEPTEGTTQFNNTMRAARYDLQLIRDMIDRGESTAPGKLLISVQDRLERSAEHQHVPLIWVKPLVDNVRFIANNYEFALARFIQTATLEALAFHEVTQVSLSTDETSDKANSGETLMIRVEANFATQPRAEFLKRAQMEAAARTLNGVLSFTESETSRGIELRWQALTGE